MEMRLAGLLALVTLPLAALVVAGEALAVVAAVSGSLALMIVWVLLWRHTRASLSA